MIPIKQQSLLIALLSASTMALAGNVATCLLDELPGVQNDPAAMATYKMCLEKFRGGLDTVAQGSGRGWFGYNSGAECAAKLAAKTPSRQAGQLIYSTCNRLYNEPNPFDLFDTVRK